MPQLFKIGSYIIYFWSNENDPLEPIHVHVAEGKATVFLLISGSCGSTPFSKNVLTTC